MSSMTATSRSEHRPAGRAFTLVEILFSVLIIGVLMGLLIVGFRSSRKFVSSVAGRTAVSNIKAAAAKFSSEFGFVPPLVRDAATNQPASVEPNGPNRSKVAVYEFSQAPSNPDLTVLRPATLTLPTSANPFEDHRYSERTIAYYLVGACNTERDRGVTHAEGSKTPIDGVVGPGFYPPNIDGTFDVPLDVQDPSRGGTTDTSKQTKRAKSRFESFIDLSGKGVSLLESPPVSPDVQEGQSGADPNGYRFARLVDAKGIPIRYYRWMNLSPITGLRDMRVPPLVGRANLPGLAYPYPIPADRDLEKNLELRDAKFAIVAAGPDGAFGDERIDILVRRLNKEIDQGDAGQVAKLRFEAEQDNIVEVGK